jgi:hypothetical protein
MVTTASTGAYLLLVRGSVKGLPVFGYAAVDVGASDIANLQIVAMPPSDVSGLVVGAPQGERIDVRLRPLLPGMANAPVTGVSPGFIAVGVSAGEYRVEANASADSYIKSIRFEDREAADGVIRLNGQLSARLEIQMGAQGAVVSGRVVNERREAVGKVRAVLTPDRARRGRHDLYKTALTNEHGDFEMRGVAPGAYSLLAWEVVQDGAWFDPNFLSFYDALGTPVRVEEHSRVTVQTAPISPWR